MPGETIAVWFRKGLRLHDNPTLVQAAKDAKHVIPFFIEEDPYPRGTNRWNFELETLHDLDKNLKAKYKSRLVYFKGDKSGDEKLTEKAISELVKKCGVTAVYYEKDFDPVNRKRDAVAAKLSAKLNFRLEGFVGHTLLDLQKAIATKGYKNPTSMANIQTILQVHFGKDFYHGVPKPVPAPKSLPSLPSSAPKHPLREVGKKSPQGTREKYFPGGETEALKRMKKRVEQDVKFICLFEKPQTFSTNSDKDPMEPFTTGLGPYITNGSLSCRQFWWAINDCYKQAGKVGVRAPAKPPQSLHGQMMFREMFYILGLAVPLFDKAQGNIMCKDIAWAKKDAKVIKAWEEGKTGYPYIDALMRQLNQNGFVHHLGRHACACFLTRGDLYQSWIHGRDVFDKLLLDADWSLNNGNWMWLGGVAPFSSPYFRVYNPCPDKKSSLNVAQDGKFIKTFVPELKNMPNQYLMEPWKANMLVQQASKCVIGKDYPKPIVDHKTAREKNIAAFGASLKSLSGQGSKSVSKQATPKKRVSGAKSTPSAKKRRK